MVRPLLRRIHRWLGLLLALPLLAQGLSGAILAIAPLWPEAEFPVQAGAPQKAMAIVAAAQTAVPPALRPVRFIPAGAPAHTALVAFVDPTVAAGHATTVRVDPVTLGVLDMDADGGAIDWLRRLHVNLLAEGRSGRSIIGWVGVGLLMLSVSGIVLWWPAPGRWRPAFTFNPRSSGVVLHRRLHGAIGIWSLLLLLISAATGVLLAFPQTARSALGLAPPGMRRPPAPHAPAGALPDIDRAIASAMQAAPGLEVRMVLLPTASTAPLRILLGPAGVQGVASAVAVSVDPAERVTAVQGPASLSAGERLLRWSHDLHFGQGLGLVWRILTIATGLVLPVFSVTGGAMWLLRRRRRQTAPQAAE